MVLRVHIGLEQVLSAWELFKTWCGRELYHRVFHDLLMSIWVFIDLPATRGRALRAEALGTHRLSATALTYHSNLATSKALMHCLKLLWAANQVLFLSNSFRMYFLRILLALSYQFIKHRKILIPSDRINIFGLTCCYGIIKLE